MIRRVAVLTSGLVLVAGCGRSATDDSVATTIDTVAVAGESTVPTTSIPTQVTYVVQPGESLSVIASRFGVDVRALADFNAIADIDTVKAGQLLSIPPVSTTTSSSTATPSAPSATSPTQPTTSVAASG